MEKLDGSIGGYQKIYDEEEPLMAQPVSRDTEKAASAGYSRLVEEQRDGIDFPEILHDSRKWQRLEPVAEKIRLGRGNPNFLFGASTCTFQDSGAANCPNSQWADHEARCLPPENRSGESANLFRLYQSAEGRKEITDRLHKLGVNSYRFSIEWSHIEPEEGVFDQDMLRIYVDLCKHLRDEGIQPMVTLHHFSEPKWFHQKGSFEDDRNIQDFVNFAKRVFPALTQPYHDRPLVELFCTINEPAIEAFSRYVRGAFSPAKSMSFTRAAHFLKGTIKAHAQAYDALKAMAPGVKIGIVHQMLEFKSSNFLISPVTKYLNYIVNEVALNCFRTGDFRFHVPGMFWSDNMIEEKGLNPKTDFVGLQYYVRPLIGFSGSTSHHEEMTTMPFREDPEGLYRAILEVNRAFGAPVIVTENGISTTSDEQRARYMERALYAAGRAQEEIGAENLLGYYVWSFCDNFEWDMGMNPQRFGAFSAESGVLAEDPKPGMRTFIDATQAWRQSLPAQSSDQSGPSH